MSSDKTPMKSREEHDRIAMVENLIWEIAKILKPNSYIDPLKIKKAKDYLLSTLKG